MDKNLLVNVNDGCIFKTNKYKGTYQVRKYICDSIFIILFKEFLNSSTKSFLKKNLKSLKYLNIESKFFLNMGKNCPEPGIIILSEIAL